MPGDSFTMFGRPFQAWDQVRTQAFSLHLAINPIIVSDLLRLSGELPFSEVPLAPFRPAKIVCRISRLLCYSLIILRFINQGVTAMKTGE